MFQIIRLWRVKNSLVVWLDNQAVHSSATLKRRYANTHRRHSVGHELVQVQFRPLASSVGPARWTVMRRHHWPRDRCAAEASSSAPYRRPCRCPQRERRRLRSSSPSRAPRRSRAGAVFWSLHVSPPPRRLRCPSPAQAPIRSSRLPPVVLGITVRKQLSRILQTCWRTAL